MKGQKNCPIDQRDFCDHRSTADINNELIVKNNIQNNIEYKAFLTKNAADLIKSNMTDLEKKYGCDTGANTMLNEQLKQNCKKTGCEIKPFDANGLGLGRDFNNLED